MLGIFLKDGKAVAEGCKTMIALPRAEDIIGRAMIVYPGSGVRYAAAMATIQPPQTTDVMGFDAAIEQHGIAPHVREALWPTAETFYLYPLTDVVPFDKPLSLPGEPGGRVRCDLPDMLVLRLVDRRDDLLCVWEEIT